MTNKIQAVVFDWAGTIIDFGCFAPTTAFIDVFAEFGNHVGLTVDELSRLTAQEVAALRKSATDMLAAAGADYVIDSVDDLPSLMKR